MNVKCKKLDEKIIFPNAIFYLVENLVKIHSPFLIFIYCDFIVLLFSFIDFEELHLFFGIDL